MILPTTFVAKSAFTFLFGKGRFFNLGSLSLDLSLLPLLLLTKRLLLQRARSNMVPFNLALEAHNLGRINNLFLALLLDELVLLLDIGLVLVIGVESKSTLVMRKLLHSQHVVEGGLPFMTLLQVFFQRSDLCLELFEFLYMVSFNTNTRGSRCYIVRATRQGK